MTCNTISRLPIHLCPREVSPLELADSNCSSRTKADSDDVVAKSAWEKSGPADCLRNRLSVNVVAFVGLYIRLHALRRQSAVPRAPALSNATIGGKHDWAVAETLGSFDALGDVDVAVHGKPFLIVVSV